MPLTNKLKWKYLRYLVYLQNHQLKSYLLPLIIFISVTAVLVFMYEIFHYASLWTEWKSAQYNALTFCEHNRFCEAIVQPSNTWSNLGFLMVGLICLFIGINDYKARQPETDNLLARYPMFSILLGASCIYLFIGSFFYHASLSYFFQKLDITGMYAVALSLIAYNMFRFFPTRYNKKKEIHRSSHHFIITLIILFNVVFFAGLWKVNVNYLFPAVLLVLMIVNIIYNLSHKQTSKLYKYFFRLSMIALFLSAALWILDREDIWCIPTSIWQGHALWHILNALSIILLYFCYRTETFNLTSIYKNKEQVYLYYK